MLSYLKKLKFKDKFKLFSVGLMIMAIIFSLRANPSTPYGLHWNALILTENFVQIIDQEEIALENVEDFQNVAIGETLILETTIPAIIDDKVVLFYTKDLEVDVFLDDENVYSFKMDEDFEFLKTPGNKWNSIDISQNDIGATLRLELTSNFANRFETTVTDIHLVDSSDIINTILKHEGFRISMTAVLFVMALFTCINGFVWERPFLKKYFLKLSNFYF